MIINLGDINLCGGAGGGGTTDYTQLENLPQINGVTLSGNVTSEQLSVASQQETSSNTADIAAIRENMDELGDVHAKSIDMDELPKVCHYDAIIIATVAPSETPDFIGQMYIDTAGGKVYVATGVTNVNDYKVLN